MGLAKQLYTNIENDYRDDIDEFGFLIEDTVDYFIARAVASSRKRRESPYTINQLYVRDGKIYYGRNEVKEDRTSAQIYANTKHRFDPAETFQFWEGIKQHLPVLDPDIIQISDNLFWDRIKGEVLNEEDMWKAYRERHPE